MWQRRRAVRRIVRRAPTFISNLAAAFGKMTPAMTRAADQVRTLAAAFARTPEDLT